MDGAPTDPALTRQLLRRSVGALAAERTCCAGCGRTPLVGETIHRYEDGRDLCALCRPREREAPARSEAVRGAAWGTAVRRRADRPDRRPRPVRRAA